MFEVLLTVHLRRSSLMLLGDVSVRDGRNKLDCLEEDKLGLMTLIKALINE